MSELLVELFSEEIPASLQEPSIKRFEFMILNNFKEVGLNFTKSEVYWSPMRLTLCVEGLGLKSEDIEINKRGLVVKKDFLDINDMKDYKFSENTTLSISSIFLKILTFIHFYLNNLQ